MGTPRVSIIIASHNRREVVINTLRQLENCEIDRRDREIIVVDNNSSDGTANTIRELPGVRVLAERRNRGSCAKALALPIAKAPILLFLDDDSYPRPGCVERMLRAFESRPQLGAAGFRVHLPDGSQECSALPHVFVGCGVGLRRAALDAAGGLHTSYFMQAEEYDVSFRLLKAGWDVRIFADLDVEHLKTPQARRSDRTTYYDIRNNLRVIAQHVPECAAAAYRADWELRYRWMAEHAGRLGAYDRGRRAGTARINSDRRRFAGMQPLDAASFERVFCRRRISAAMKTLRDGGVRRIALADLGKNILPFVTGARENRIQVTGIYDSQFAAPGRAYRELPLLDLNALDARRLDAIVVSNTSYVHATRRAEQLRQRIDLPILNWFTPAFEMTTASRSKAYSYQIECEKSATHLDVV